MTNLTSLIARLRELEKAATKGPYEWSGQEDYPYGRLVSKSEKSEDWDGEMTKPKDVLSSHEHFDLCDDNDAEYIEAALNAFPLLLSALEKAVGALEKIKDESWSEIPLAWTVSAKELDKAYGKALEEARQCLAEIDEICGGEK